MGFAEKLFYTNPADGEVTPVNVTVNLSRGIIPGLQSSRYLLEASAGGTKCYYDLNTIVKGLFNSRRNSMPFDEWRNDGWNKLSAKYEMADGYTLTVYAQQTTSTAPKFEPVTNSFAKHDICFIYDGLDQDGLPINYETFLVESYSGTTLTVSFASGKTAFANDHPKGSIVRKVDVEALRFLFASIGISGKAGVMAQSENVSSLSGLTLTGGSNQITIQYTTAMTYGFTPVFDVYIKSRQFTFLNEENEPELDNSSPKVVLENLTVADLATGKVATTYGGGSDCHEGGNLSAGDYWVALVTKTAAVKMNVPESLPAPVKVTVT